MKFDEKNIALSFSITLGVLYIICSLVYYLAPSLFSALGGYLMHGIELSKTAKPFFFGQFAGGLALTVILSYAGAYFFATVYNYLDTEDK